MATFFQQADGSETALLPRELSMLISDCLEAPATFLLVQHIAQALKNKRKCILFGLSQSFDYYNAILRKQVCPSGAVEQPLQINADSRYLIDF